MAARIVIQPVVTVDGARRPLSATLADPGRPAASGLDDYGQPLQVPKHLVHVSAISDGQPGQRNDDCLSVVAGRDLSNLDAAYGVTTLFEAGTDKPLADLKTWLNSTPNEQGWLPAKRQRIIGRLTAAGADISGITGDTPLWQIVNRLGQVWQTSFDVRVLKTFAPGA